MINAENLNKLYEKVISSSEIATKELNLRGFNSKDINELIEQGKIKRVRRGFYVFLSVDDLYLFGKKINANKRYDEAIKCYEKVHELDPMHYNTCFQLFSRCVFEKNYEKAFEYFDILFQSDNKFYIKETNFYLFLLNTITEIPEKHREYAKFLTKEDILIDNSDKRYKDIQIQNQIRLTAFQRKFPLALKNLNELILNYNFKTMQDVIARNLLFQATEIETKNKKSLTDFAYNREYEKIVDFLEGKQKRYSLSLYEQYILKLAEVLLNFYKTENIPRKTIFQTSNLFEAIDGNNFELALKISNEYNEKNNINNNENALNLLLFDICEGIEKIKKKETNDEMLEEEYNSDEITTNKNCVKTTTSTFSDIIKFLLQKDLENAFITLRNYLDLINKRNYEFLIVDLIKISIHEGDIAFTKPMVALTYITKENFDFDINTYIQLFYVALSENKYDIARIYLDIMLNAKNIGVDCSFVGDLIQIFNNTEKIDAPSKEIKNLEKSVIQKEKSEKSKIIQNKITLPLNNMVSDSEKKFIESKYEELLNNQGIVMLKPMDAERRKRIHKIVESYNDMVSFSIGEGNNRQIVLRYKPFIEECLDIPNLIRLGNKSYELRNYDDCINYYLQILHFGTPKAGVYAKLGLAYMRKNEIENAIMYLTIATYLTKKENNEYDFTELLMRLKGEINKEDIKPRIKNVDFDSDTNYYGIDDFYELNSFILESGLDVETACKDFGKTEEETDIVKLIYAREYYFQGNYEKGDQFLKLVEKGKNKTESTKKLIKEIKNNRKYYKNRNMNREQKLSLTIKPKK